MSRTVILQRQAHQTKMTHFHICWAHRSSIELPIVHNKVVKSSPCKHCHQIPSKNHGKQSVDFHCMQVSRLKPTIERSKSVFAAIQLFSNIHFATLSYSSDRSIAARFRPCSCAHFLAISYPASACRITPAAGSFQRTRFTRSAAASLPSQQTAKPACCE